MNDHAAVLEPRAFGPAPPLAPTASRRTGWMILPAAAQVLPAMTARNLGLSEGRHRFVLFLIVCALFGTIVPVEIAADSQMFVSRTIMGIPPHYALTAAVVALAVLFDLRYYQRLVARAPVALGLACILVLLFEGALRYGIRSYLVRSDLYIIRWFFVGFILMRLATAAGMLRPYLMFAAVVILLTAAGIDARNTEAGQIDTGIKRVTSSNLWPVINCGTVMIGLLLTVAWPRSWHYAAFGSGAFAILTFIGSIRSSTRSLFAVQALCLIFILLALARDPRMSGRGRGVQRAATAFALLGVALVVFQIVTGSLLGEYTQLADRFSQTTRESRVAAGRIDEAVQMVEELTPDEWVLGKGLGGMFYSTLGAWTNVPHIAVLGWLQKGGLPLFLIVLVTVYIAPSVAFFRQLSRPRKASPLPPPILVVGPMLVSWCGLTLVSGGIDIGSFLGLGGLTYVWMQLADDDKLYEADRRRSGFTARGGRAIDRMVSAAGAA